MIDPKLSLMAGKIIWALNRPEHREKGLAAFEKVKALAALGAPRAIVVRLAIAKIATVLLHRRMSYGRN